MAGLSPTSMANLSHSQVTDSSVPTGKTFIENDA